MDFADRANNRIRMISPGGIITTIGGNGTNSTTGDGAAATSAAIGAPSGLATDPAGNVYLATTGRVRKIDTSGIITTVVACC